MLDCIPEVNQSATQYVFNAESIDIYYQYFAADFQYLGRIYFIKRQKFCSKMAVWQYGPFLIFAAVSGARLVWQR